MKLSWSHKLFLKINEHIGKRPLLDAIMSFCGNRLIWILFFSFALFFFLGIFENTIGFDHIKITILSFCIAYAISYTLALIFPHQRPIKELPQIKSLFTTLSTWKSFPSDHTIAVVLFFLLSSAFFASPVEWFFLVGGILVASGRVYGGVHYPRDILGGVVVAAFSVWVMNYPHLF